MAKLAISGAKHPSSSVKRSEIGQKRPSPRRRSSPRIRLPFRHDCVRRLFSDSGGAYAPPPSYLGRGARLVSRPLPPSPPRRLPSALRKRAGLALARISCAHPPGAPVRSLPGRPARCRSIPRSARLRSARRRSAFARRFVLAPLPFGGHDGGLPRVAACPPGVLMCAGRSLAAVRGASVVAWSPFG